MFMTSMEIIKGFVNDPDVIKFKRNDQSRLIDVSNHIKEVEKAKIIQAFSKSMSTKEIAEILDLPEEKKSKNIST